MMHKIFSLFIILLHNFICSIYSLDHTTSIKPSFCSFVLCSESASSVDCFEHSSIVSVFVVLSLTVLFPLSSSQSCSDSTLSMDCFIIASALFVVEFTEGLDDMDCSFLLSEPGRILDPILIRNCFRETFNPALETPLEARNKLASD